MIVCHHLHVMIIARDDGVEEEEAKVIKSFQYL